MTIQMKRWSTTPVSINKKTAKRITIITVTVLLALTMPFGIMNIVKADTFDERIARIQKEIDDFQAQAGKLNGQADSLQKEMDALTAQKNVIQKQIDLKQAEHDKLVQDIADNEKKITDGQNALGDTIADLYISNDISPLEMLASSKNISDFVDKQTYQNTIKDSLFTTIQTIKHVRNQLIDKKKDVE